MGKKYFGKIPVNARITIDYKNGINSQPKIKFDYPKKGNNEAVKQTKSIAFLFLFFVLLSLIILSISLLPIFHHKTVYPTNCNYYSRLFSEDNITKIKNLILTCDNGLNQTFKFSGYKVDTNVIKYFFYDQLGIRITTVEMDNYDVFDKLFMGVLYSVSVFLFLFLFLFCLPMILAKPLIKFMLKYKWVKQKLPKWQELISGKKTQAIFTKVPVNNIIEIPLFSNVKLYYNAEEQFATYLEKVEIREHPFNNFIVKKKSIKKKEKSIFYWYAKFYFKQQPKNGKLEVIFK